MVSATDIDAIVESFLESNGPGAAVAVLRDGEVAHARAYGVADLDTAAPVTTQSAFRICSITKQFTCLLIRMLAEDGRLDLSASPRRYLKQCPAFMDGVNLRQLCQNVSGLRDYWCLAMLAGAQAETRFRRPDAERIIFGQGSFQFTPGTQFSYNNGNFTLLGWIIEAVTGQPYAQVLKERIFATLGMTSSLVQADTMEPLAGGTVGYEPGANSTQIPAVVDINWEGDAGIVTNLEDMIRWEMNFMQTRAGHPGLIEGLFETPTFEAALPSNYGFGVRLGRYRGFSTQGHEGALRGWRACRLRFVSESLSVIVLLNHLSDAGELARLIADRYLPGQPDEPRSFAPAADANGRLGHYLDHHSGKCFELRNHKDELFLNAMGMGRGLCRAGADAFTDRTGDVRISFPAAREERATLHVPGSNYHAELVKVPGLADASGVEAFSGVFRSPELRSTLQLEPDDAQLRITCTGPLGTSAGWPTAIAGENLALLGCARALDQQPPGEFALWLQREGRAPATALLASCGLAPGIRFVRD